MDTATARGYLPHSPTPKQAEFLQLTCREAFYGGSAGGGKSDALLMAALQYVCVRDYAAIIFRRTYPQLEQPGGLIPRSREWLTGTGATYNQQTHTWTFPSGAVLKLSHLQYDDTVYDHQSSEYQFIGFDELTHFTESQFRYLFSRLRRSAGSPIPLRVRSASNPGGLGHDWVKARYITADTRQTCAVYIPARLTDNPHIDTDEYTESLQNLTITDRQRLLDGDWDAAIEGTKFKREWFTVVDEAPVKLKRCRFWDMAATEPSKGRDPDYTAGALLGRCEAGLWWLLDVARFRKTPAANEALVAQQAQLDGAVPVRMEQEPGASGKGMIDHYARLVLPGFDFKGRPASGSKEVRANPVSAAAEAGNVHLVRGEWNAAFLDEAAAFPSGPHDDQIDAVSGAMAELSLGFISPHAPGGPKVKPKDESVEDVEARLMDTAAAWVGAG